MKEQAITSVTEITLTFTHRQSSHCESGVAANLMHHYGYPISEAMAFGIGEGLFFAYMPFIKVNQLPVTTFRCVPGRLIKRLTQRFGIQITSQTFATPRRAMRALDDVLAEGQPVGCRTGAYWLPYFPEALRFHFNAHNIVVIGKKGDDYLISDPVFPEPVICSAQRLAKARFAKGALAPKGFMYRIHPFTREIDQPRAIRQSIRSNCHTMLTSRFPLVGTRGIRFLADRLEKWPVKLGEEKSLGYLGQLIRMQEEIGTGGAGFRFIYAAFLQEASHVLADDRLARLSEQMTVIGDLWRHFALLGSRNCKGRATAQESFPAMAGILRECAALEGEIYQKLLQIN